MIDSIARKLLEQKSKKLNRRVGVFNLKSAKTALLVYDATNPNFEKEIRAYAHFLKEEGIKTDTIGFYKLKGKEDQPPKDELGYKYFTKNEINFLGFPKNEKLEKLISKDYNLLIDINTDSNLSLEIITTLSKANFKVGDTLGYKTQVCDLTIENETNTISSYLKAVTTYLKMINTK